MIERAHLKAPPEHQGVLIEPPAGALLRATGIPQRSAAQRALCSDLLGELGLPEGRPVIATGHQVEFYHAGVLAKTIAVDELVRRSDASGVYLVVDFDTPKARTLAVPERTPAGPRRIEVAIPGCDPRLPVAAQPQVPAGQWLDFFARVAGLRGELENTMLRPFVDAWCEGAQAAEPLDYCRAMSRGRRAVESRLGVERVREITAAALCQTRIFGRFAARLLWQAAEFAAIYNAAQAEYRERHRVRTRAAPAPDLQRAGPRWEAPFWLLRPGEPRRRVFVERDAGGLLVFANEAVVCRWPGAAYEDLIALGVDSPGLPEGWQLRPRALTFSCFVRLFLADLFVHGIGGAKYDEATELFARFFEGFELAPIACVTATALLLAEGAAADDDGLRAARRRARDVQYNPQRYIADLPPHLLARRAELIRAGTQLRERARGDRGARRAVYDELRALRRELLSRDPWRPAGLAEEVQQREAQAQAGRVSRDREYFFGLLPTVELRALADRVRAAFA